MGTRKRNVLVRQWALIQELGRHARGCSPARLMACCEASHATVYRDLQVLREAGFPIETFRVSGEARHTLASSGQPSLSPSAAQLMALRFARRMLGPLEGSSVARELDELLRPLALAEAGQARIALGRSRRSGLPDVLAELERALSDNRRVRIRVRTRAQRSPSWRVLDPIALRYVEGALYLIAFDVKKAALRTFKLARITHVLRLREQADAHPAPAMDEGALFERAVKVWTGDVIDVQVQLSAAVAHLVDEYVLIAGQTLQANADGSVVVRARVSGVPETARWVLGWGKDAEVLAPASLRAFVAEQVGAAARRYLRPATARG